MNIKGFIGRSKEDKLNFDSINSLKLYADATGDLVQGILLRQIVKDLNGYYPVHRDNKDWLPRARKDWWEACRLTPRQFDRVVTALEKKGLVTKRIFRYKGIPMTHVAINAKAVRNAMNKANKKGAK